MKGLLALAAAGALEPGEEAALENHAATCVECAEARQAWLALGAGLRRLPTPQPPPALLERTRLLAAARLMGQAEIRSTRRMITIAIAFAWVMGLASWPLMNLAGRAVLGWANWPASEIWVPLAGYTLLAFFAAGIAALILGLKARSARRTA